MSALGGPEGREAPEPGAGSAGARAGEGAGLAEAMRALAAGGLVAFPTETVWGLAADATSEAAVERLRAWKGRGADQPLSVLVEDAAAAEALGARLSPGARRLAETLWPGPLTLVLPCAARLAAGLARADGAVGFRCSPQPAARALAQAAAEAGLGPLTATSLNRTGEPPARTVGEARRACRGTDAPLVFAPGGEEAGGGPPSSVVDATGERPACLREGALPARRIEELWKEDDAE